MLDLSHEPNSAPDLYELLRSDGILRGQQARLTPLTGGVSSEIYLVSDGPKTFVVKRALPQLKVTEQWFADTNRNASEAAYIHYVGTFSSENVPRLQYVSTKHGYFCMEYLGAGWQTWKTMMFDGHRNPAIAATAGALLGRIHAWSSRDRKVASQFRTLSNFEQLRIEPYLLSTARHHPSLEYKFEAEASRLRQQEEVLTHGDFSPKNILVRHGRLVVVDCEVAWYGDAAFDIAFLLNHLFLKSLALPASELFWREMVQASWSSYLSSRFTNEADEQKRMLEGNTTRLLLMLMLARVDGKSPVEYLTEDQRRRVRSFAVHQLTGNCKCLSVLAGRWFQSLQQR